MLPHYYELLTRLDQSAVIPELKYNGSFLRFNADGFPTGRPFSYFCNRLNENKKHKANNRIIETRAEFLERMRIPDYKEVYDIKSEFPRINHIKSEFPRINHLFHTGIWKPDNYDFYNEIIKDTMLELTDGLKIARGATQYTDEADSFKRLFMRMYNGKGTVVQSYNGWLADKRKEIDEGIKGGIYDKKNAYLLYRFFDEVKYWNCKDEKGKKAHKEVYGDYLYFEAWEKLYNSTVKLIGSFLGNLVMWFAFFIETEVKIELLNRDKVVYNVYDGFYFDRDIGKETELLVAEKALFVYENYMKKIKK
jgi:hypothetical protein